jgi:chromosome segregation ATPase
MVGGSQKLIMEQEMAEHDFPQLEIPEQVAAALGNWVQQAAREAGTPLHAEIASLRAQLEAARATLEENDDQITRLNGELRNARNIAADALVGKAKDQLAIEGKDAQIADLRSQLERSVAIAATLSDAKLAAEMELVGATTARDNYLAEASELRTQLEACRAARRAA